MICRKTPTGGFKKVWIKIGIEVGLYRDNYRYQ